MKPANQRIDQQTAIKLLVLAGLILLFGFFLYAFANAGAPIQSALIAAGSALVLATYGYREQHRRSEKEAHRVEKVAVYGDFFEIMFEVLKRKTEAEIESFLQQDEIQSRMRKFWTSVLFLGSPEVIDAYRNWNRASALKGTGESFRAIACLVLAMRGDLGLSNKGLTENSIMEFLSRPNPKNEERRP
jgi:hypothetical protein